MEIAIITATCVASAAYVVGKAIEQFRWTVLSKLLKELSDGLAEG